MVRDILYCARMTCTHQQAQFLHAHGLSNSVSWRTLQHPAHGKMAVLGCAGVLLLLWAPAKRAARSGSTRAELAAAAAQEHAAKCEEILRQAGPADADVPPCLKFHSWRCFLGRWRAALTAAAGQSGTADEQVGALMTCAHTLATMQALPHCCCTRSTPETILRESQRK